MKFSREPTNPSKACKAMGVDLRVHYKNTWNVAEAIKGMNLRNAQKYLEAVVEKKQCIPFRRYTGCIGRTPQAKAFKMSQGRWPIKSCKIVLDLLRNADFKNLDADNLSITHIQVQRAQHGRRRTYRAHGRINPYQSSPCHVQMILQEKDEDVEKPEEEKTAVVKKFTKKQLAQKRLKIG